MNIVSHGQRVQYTMCDRKLRFKDKYSADVEVGRILAESNDSRKDRINSYQCPYCDGWHIGHVREGKKVYR